MKLALIFLSIFVAISHQQYYRNPRMMFAFPWLAMPFSQDPVFFGHNYDYAAAAKEDVYPAVENNQHIFTGEEDEEQEEFADIQSRIKGISRYRPRPSFQDQQNARFLFNLFASTTGAFNNPLLKTATFTSTVTLSLNSIQNCVPVSEAVANIAPCQPNQQQIGRRRRRDTSSFVPEDLQFPITPSNTFSLMPTVLSSTSNDQSFDQLSSSKEDGPVGEISLEDNHDFRKKRFFINKNQFVVSTVATTFVFVNSTVRATVNLINPPPAAAVIPCVPGAPGAVQALPVCLLCLPPGFIVCPAPTG